MRKHISAIGLTGLLIALAFATTACDRLPAVVAALSGSKPASTTAGGSTSGSDTATGSVESTSTDGADASDAGTTGTAVEVSHGRIYTPAMGTPLRKSLMDAARRALNTTSQFVVHQLWVQGDAAIGDIQPTKSGQRHFVVWAGPDWKVVWAAPFGSSKANAARVARDVPRASTQLVGRIDFKYVPGPNLATLKASARAKTAAWYNGLIRSAKAPKGTHAVTTAARLYKDGDGVWWAAVGVNSSPSYLEGTSVIWRWSGGAWHRFSVEGSDGFYPAVPKSVRVGLGYSY